MAEGNQRGRIAAARLMTGVAFAAMLAAAGPTLAQTQGAAKADDSNQVSEVVVTGTLIRGLAAPTGSDLLTVNTEQIKATGTTNAIELLNQTVPQLPSFNTVSTGTAGYGLAVTKIGLRGFGTTTGNASGATATLVLFNGHRVVPTGILSTDPDPQLIPADALEAVQVMPDGGSATYGSDAVGGVVNFVTRKRFQGVLVHAQEAFADQYNETNVSVVTGNSWAGGGLVLSFVHNEHDAIFGKDRGYITQNHTAHGGADYRSGACAFGAFTVNGTTYSGQTFSPAAAPKCEQADYTSLVPSEQRNSVFGYLEQDLTESLKFSVDSMYSIRRDHVYVDTAGIAASLNINASNPFFHPVAGETSQVVNFNYSRALGPYLVTPQEFKQWQVDPSLTWRINSDWQARVDLLYGRSTATLQDREGLNNAVNTATTVNPYDPGLTPAATRAALANHELYTQGENILSSAQLVVDGKLFSLPGGDVRLAAGAEYRRHTLSNLTYTSTIGDLGSAQLYPARRSITAEFAELFVPIVGKGNSVPLVRELSLDVAVRHDDYSDFGGTTNPRFGIDYKPFEDLVIRANYQTTFDAPSLADSGNQIDTRLIAIPIIPRQYLLVIAGAGQNVKPETGKTFSVGFDWSPSAVPGLRVGATYWHTKLDNLVGLSLGQFGLIGSLSTSYNLCGIGLIFPVSSGGPCTAAFVNSLQSKWVHTDFGNAPGVTTVGDLFTPGSNILAFLDARRGNFGTEKIDGVDFTGQYSWELSLGRAFVNVAGTYVLNKEISPFPGGAFADYLSGDTVLGQTPRYNVVASAGLSHGPFLGRVTVTHNAGYKIPPGTSVGQSKVDSFTLVGAYFSVDLGSFSIAKSNTLEVSVDNVFDKEPPYYGAQVVNGSIGGFANGGTLGRLFRIGLRSNF